MSETTLLPRLKRARLWLLVSSVSRAVLSALIAVLAIIIIWLLIDGIVGLPVSVRKLVTPAALGCGMVVLVFSLRRYAVHAAKATNEELALWFENRMPSLRYALVTSVDPSYEGGAQYTGSIQALERTAAAAPLESEISVAVRSALLRPFLIVLMLGAALFLLPKGAVARVTAPAAGDLLNRLGTDARAEENPLAAIVVHVTPPAYAGLPAESHDDPSTVAALAGSRVLIEGRGSAVSATMGDRTLSAREDNGSWSVTVPLPYESDAVRLRAGERERILVLDPVADSSPVVRLDEPVRDSVLREPSGEIYLRADVRDDIGIAEAGFEYIISTGSGEAFNFRTGKAAVQTFTQRTRTTKLEHLLVLDTLGLKPGDLIHLRAIATDHNNVTGPGLGASETRTIRIARPGEYDSVSVEPIPPSEPEKTALSQRMILMLTEELRDRQPRMSARDHEQESRKIAAEQMKLRKAVGEVVFVRLGEDAGEHVHFAGDGHDHGQEGLLSTDDILSAAERAASIDPTADDHGDESPIVSLNLPLLEAYNHMWRAGTEMELASPRTAIPWMERAIEALQRARAAERIYLRGRPARIVVDIAKVRGTGKEQGASNVRTPREVADETRLQRVARFDATLSIVVSNPQAAADSLLLLRLELPEEERTTAHALDAAADQLRRGGDVTDVLVRARLLLAGEPVRRSGLGNWGM